MWGVGEESVAMDVLYTYMKLSKKKLEFFQGNKISLSGEGVSRYCRIQLGWFIVARGGRVRQN